MSTLARMGSRSWLARWVLILAVMLLGGCASKSYVVLIPSPDGSVGEVVVKGSKGEQVLNKAGQAGLLDGSPLRVDERQVKEDFGDTIAALPRIPVRFLLYFSTGITLTAESQSLIPKIIADAGEPCPNACGAVICRSIGERSSFYCPTCQRNGRRRATRPE